MRSFVAIALSLIEAQAIAGLLLVGAIHVTLSQHVARLRPDRALLEAFMAVSLVALLVERALAKIVADRHAAIQRMRSDRRVLLVGGGRLAADYIRLLRTNRFWTMKVIGRIDAGLGADGISAGVNGTNGVNGISGAHGSNGNHVQQSDDWTLALKQYSVDEVVAVCPWNEAPAFDGLAQACAERGVVFRLMVAMPAPKAGAYEIEDIGGGRYLVSLETIPQAPVALMVKRLLDVAGAAVGLLACAAVWPVYALWLRLVSPGPVLFRQQRLGRNGRAFVLYKFRTMHPNAEAELADLAGRNEMRGAIFKIKNDPRVICGGQFMRRTHLDELPQFWNVLSGDMSLVGTRPPTPEEAASYEARHHRRLSMRPGITGAWQVNGNGAIRDFEEVVKLDCRYIDNWSLGLDLKLLAKTVTKVVRAAGW
jgi:exopolysaccharide biosynthesis polyprenyl glycosylphosphotransferase